MKQQHSTRADLSAIGKACGGEVHGILGVDLLEQLSVTIDLERHQVPLRPLLRASEQECIALSRSSKRASFSDPDFVLSTPSGELRGRDESFSVKVFWPGP